MSTLAKEMSQLTVGASGYMIQLSYQVTHTTNAKSLTSHYNARTRPYAIEPGSLNMWCYNEPLRSFMTWWQPHERKWSYTPYNTTTTLTPILQRSSNRSIHMVTSVTLVTYSAHPERGLALILCPVNILPKVGWTGISITPIPLRLVSLLYVSLIHLT